MLELDKDKVMPLIDGLAVVAQWEDGPDIADKVSGAQRDADLLRIKPLVEAARDVIPFLYECNNGECVYCTPLPHEEGCPVARLEKALADLGVAP